MPANNKGDAETIFDGRTKGTQRIGAHTPLENGHQQPVRLSYHVRVFVHVVSIQQIDVYLEESRGHQCDATSVPSVCFYGCPVDNAGGRVTANGEAPQPAGRTFGWSDDYEKIEPLLNTDHLLYN